LVDRKNDVDPGFSPEGFVKFQQGV
jgi:hypothetical protein